MNPFHRSLKQVVNLSCYSLVVLFFLKFIIRDSPWFGNTVLVDKVIISVLWHNLWLLVIFINILKYLNVTCLPLFSTNKFNQYSLVSTFLFYCYLNANFILEKSLHIAGFHLAKSTMLFRLMYWPIPRCPLFYENSFHCKIIYI